MANSPSLLRMLSTTLLCAAPLAQDSPGEPAGSAPATWREALTTGRTWIDARYRFELVDDKARPKDAYASTLRTRLGYETMPFHGWRGLLELENVTAIGNDLYDSTTNGETSRAVVADPEGTEVNQAYLRFDPRQDAELWLGRRRIQLDNDRFVGNVGWRQNEQTFDSLGLDWMPDQGPRVFYAYVGNANRVFGDDNPTGDARMHTHLLNVSRDFEGVGKAVLYWYYIDVDAPGALDGFSTSTVGGRLGGEQPLDGFSLTYAGEYAHQVDVADNPGDVSADYWLAELGAKRSGTGLTLGYEVLGGSSDAGDKFTTPLATLHAFNGWADKFLVTPDGGLQDLYATLGGKLGDLGWALVYHDFQADSGGADYGTELDALLTHPVSDGVAAGLKLARYDADEFAEDTTKLWFWLSLSL